MPGVTAILVERDGDESAARALAASTRRPDAVVRVPAGSSLARVVADLPRPPRAADDHPALFGSPGDDEWLWILPGSAAPEPDALARLLGAVEVAPSVVIAGPKLVDHDDRTLLRSYGESVTRHGTTIPLADDELDQSQHDAQDDVLGVVLPGMLIRRSMFELLGGPDRGLSSFDAGLDLSMRARLAGGRVVRVAGARVAVAEGAQDFLRRRPLSPGARDRVRRTAHLHRRLVYAPRAAVPFHWLSLVPLAIVRALGMLLAKRPAAIPGEIAAAFAAAFDGSVPAARASLRRTRRVDWSALAPLRIPPDVVQERRATARDREYVASGIPDIVRASFLPGGLAVTVVGAAVGTVLSLRLFGADALAGGALLPVGDLGGLWTNLDWGPRDGQGLAGPADPAHVVLAVLGSLTPWNPSLALVVLWIAAPALSALAAWWAATRFSARAWPPVVAALLWMLAPPFLAALAEGRPYAVIVHVLLPWFVLALLEAPRSWSAAGAAALLLAAIGASAPVLAPALLGLVVAWAVAHPRALVRVLVTSIPLLALAAPLIAAQFARGTPLGLLADPGPAVPFATPSGWHLLLGSPSAGSDGWSALVALVGLPAELGTVAAVAFWAPLAAIVLLALFLPGARRALPAAIVAFAGLVTAVASAHLAPSAAGAEAVAIWPGAGLSLYWGGMIAAVAVGLTALRAAGAGVGAAVVLSALVAVAPALAGLVSAGAVGPGGVVGPGDGRTMPAIVAAEAAGDPGLGTLVLRPQSDGSLSASIERGTGATLASVATYATTRPEGGADQDLLAELAGNLASRGGYDPAPVLADLGLEFVVLTPVDALHDRGAALVRDRAAEALDAQPALSPVGDTVRGSLWRFGDHEPVPPLGAGAVFGTPTLVAQAAVLVFAFLLALPTGRRRRRVAPGPEHELTGDVVTAPGDLDGEDFDTDAGDAFDGGAPFDDGLGLDVFAPPTTVLPSVPDSPAPVPGAAPDPGGPRG